MAEFCLECWNRINGTKDDKRKYILSKELELCEGCGEWKNIIVEERSTYYAYKLMDITLPFRILWRLLKLPYLIFKYVISKKENRH